MGEGNLLDEFGGRWVWEKVLNRKIKFKWRGKCQRLKSPDINKLREENGGEE